MSADKIYDLGGSNLSCCSDCGVCLESLCCPTTNYHVDSAARYAVMTLRENVGGFGCCGLCTPCHLANIEVRLNVMLGGTPDWWSRFCCICCCPTCHTCQFARAMKALELQRKAGAPQGEVEMAR